ncbi:MAG: MFS family permease [Kiritimatiellia bacterium]|jgi:MFS family permease
MHNVRLHRWYQAGRNALFWMPVFFLFFSERCSLEQVLQLEALYYVVVVVLEVPSGYASDRLGRTITLRISALAGLASALLFCFADGLWGLALAQVLFAACMAFNSGTDSALLYESLQSEGRSDETVYHESIAASWGALSAGVAAVIGGLAGSLWLVAPYVLTAVVAVGTVGMTFLMREPVGTARAEAPLAQAALVVRLIRRPVLAWVAAWAVAMTVFNHVPYEFFQPWLGYLLDDVGGGAWSATPVAAGLMVGGTMWLTSVMARLAPRVHGRLGTGGTLILAMLIQAVVMAAMGLWVHPAVALVLLARGAPRGLGEPVVRGELHPRLPDGLRATWFSVQSLVGRLAFSMSLLFTSLFVSGTLTHALMSRILMVSTISAVVVAAVLGVAWRWARPSISEPTIRNR